LLAIVAGSLVLMHIGLRYLFHYSQIMTTEPLNLNHVSRILPQKNVSVELKLSLSEDDELDENVNGILLYA